MMKDQHMKGYLGFLQVDLQGAPTLERLRGLVKVHLQLIPFENISKFHYYLHNELPGWDGCR